MRSVCTREKLYFVIVIAEKISCSYTDCKMSIFHWILNFFSLSTSFGALVVLGVLYIWLRKRGILLLFLTILFLTASYGTGLWTFLSNTGLGAPNVSDTTVLSYDFTLLNILSQAADLLLILIIPLIPQSFFGKKERWIWFVLIPFVILGYLLPLIPAENWSTNTLRSFVIGGARLSGYIFVFVYGMSAPLRWRNLIPERIRKVIRYILVYFTFFHFPLMILEDVLMITGKLPLYNTVEALGFFGLTTSTIIVSLLYMIRGQETSAASLEKFGLTCSLTGRELEVLPLLAEGQAYKEIADSLNISLDTVKTHASSVYRKTGTPGKQALKYLVLDKLG